MKVEYDIDPMMKAFGELDPKRRVQALRNALRSAGRQVRSRAVSHLREKTHRNRELERGIRIKPYKKKAVGFRVTIGTDKKEHGFYKTKAYRRSYDKAREKGHDEKKSHEIARPNMKPVLLWAESGTKVRKTKTRTRFFSRKRKGHNTGAMPAWLFMEKTQREVAPEVTKMVHDELVSGVEKIIKKYGNK